MWSVPTELTRASFEGLLGQTFHVEVADGPLELRLVGLEPLAPQRPPLRRDPFSIKFTGPVARLLPQRIYKLVNEKLELPMIFLVPVGPGDHGFPLYEAVFN